MIKSIVLGQVRHLIGASGIGLATWLIDHGASPDDANVICAGLLALASFGWSFYDKYRTHTIIAQKLNQ